MRTKHNALRSSVLMQVHVQITYMRTKHNLSWHISPVLAEIVNGDCWLAEHTLSPLRAPRHGRLMGLHSSPP